MRGSLIVKTPGPGGCKFRAQLDNVASIVVQPGDVDMQESTHAPFPFVTSTNTDMVINPERAAKLANLKSQLQNTISHITAIKIKRRGIFGETEANPRLGTHNLRALILERCQLQALIARF